MGFETYHLGQGKIIVAFSDKNLSVGYLELDPNKQLKKHNRPCAEYLYQIKGTCTMVLFDGNSDAEEIILREGDQLQIPSHKFHIHKNLSTKRSITMWKFIGDITGIITDIRKNAIKGALYQ